MTPSLVEPYGRFPYNWRNTGEESSKVSGPAAVLQRVSACSGSTIYRRSSTKSARGEIAFVKIIMLTRQSRLDYNGKRMCSYRTLQQLLCLVSFLICFIVIEAFAFALRILMLCGCFRRHEDIDPAIPHSCGTVNHTN
jgi:hypothetical protein